MDVVFGREWSVEAHGSRGLSGARVDPPDETYGSRSHLRLGVRGERK